MTNLTDQMNYELALSLDEAGFPQGGSGKWIGDPRALVMRSEDRVYAPTLAELIAACGDQFGTLAQIFIELEEDGDLEANYWVAATSASSAIHGPGWRNSEGATPEEAVANLWLALIDSKA